MTGRPYRSRIENEIDGEKTVECGYGWLMNRATEGDVDQSMSASDKAMPGWVEMVA